MWVALTATNGFLIFPMPTTNSNMPGHNQIASLRLDARGALMARKRADARVILGRLVSMSGDADDAKNLEVLVESVREEVSQYTRKSGDIGERLRSGIPLSAVQAELDKAISHWRAFTNDLAELAIARDGLPAHEDPELKRKLGELEKKLTEGAVHEVMSSWIEIGQPEAAAKGVFVQILNAFADLDASIQKQNWKGAKQRTTALRQLMETEDGIPFQNGCHPQISTIEDRLRWELILMKCESSTGLTGRERSRFLVELSRANNDIEFRIRENPALEEIHSRIKLAIEDMSAAPVAVEKPTNLAKPLIAVLVLIVLILIAFWVYFRSTESNPSTSHFDWQHQSQSLLRSA